MADDGLAPPSPPRPKGPAIERGPDLEAGFVQRETKHIVASQDSYVGRLGVAATTQTSGKPGFQPFKASSGTQLESHLDKSFNASSPELTMARFVGSSIMNPFTSAVDEYQVSKISRMQEEFYKKHDYTLKALSKDLAHAKGAMDRLGRWLGEQQIPDNGIRRLMDKKAATGKQAMRDLDDAMGAAEDPQDREKLRAMKDDFQKWSNERDERLKPEWKEEAALESRIDALNREIHQNQQSALHDAAMSDGPVTETGNGKVTSSTHQHPQSLSHVSSLRDFLLGNRLRVVKAIRGAP